MMLRIIVFASVLFAGVSAVTAQNDQVTTTQLAMKSNLKSALTLSEMVKDKKPYDQAAVNTALAELEDVAKRFPALFPVSIKGLRPKGDYYASDKVWTERAEFEARAVKFAQAVGDAKGKIKDIDGLKAIFPGINGACLGCHETFRIRNG
jgi:cytochrome c556